MARTKGQGKAKKESADAQPGELGEEGPSTSAASRERLELQRTRVICSPDMNYHVSCKPRRGATCIRHV